MFATSNIFYLYEQMGMLFVTNTINIPKNLFSGLFNCQFIDLLVDRINRFCSRAFTICDKGTTL